MSDKTSTDLPKRDLDLCIAGLGKEAGEPFSKPCTLRALSHWWSLPTGPPAQRGSLH